MALKQILISITVLFFEAGANTGSGESGNCSLPSNGGTCVVLDAKCGSNGTCVCNNTGTLICSESSSNASGGGISIFDSDFFVCLMIAGVVTLFAALACCAIKFKAASHRSSGNQAPKPLVALSSDYDY